MSDLISRQAAIEALQNHYEVRNPKQNAIMDECVMLIFNVPSARTEIIRCKECKWYKDFDGCFFSTTEVKEDDFCSNAERGNDE